MHAEATPLELLQQNLCHLDQTHSLFGDNSSVCSKNSFVDAKRQPIVSFRLPSPDTNFSEVLTPFDMSENGQQQAKLIPVAKQKR